MTTTATPAARQVSLRGLAMPLGVAASLGAGGIYTAVNNPYEPGFFPPCIFLAASGHLCPGCGGLRATHELLNGNLIGALDMNPVVTLVILPMIAIGLAWWIAGALGAKVPRFRITTGQALILPIFLGVFWVVRNIPALEPFLAP